MPIMIWIAIIIELVKGITTGKWHLALLFVSC